MRAMRWWLVAGILIAGCGPKPAAKPDSVQVELAPDQVSSQDGTVHVRATVLSGRSPLAGWNVSLSIDYVDRKGATRPIPTVTGKSDHTGAFAATIPGFSWEGAATVTAQVLDKTGAPYLRAGQPITGSGTFAVLDMSPPAVTIQPPTSDLKVGRGLPVDVPVTVTDEIGLSSVSFQVASPDIVNQQTTLIASGSTSATVVFSFNVPDFAIAGPTITLYALGQDLSGNITAAAPVTLSVDANIHISVPPGLTAGPVASAGLSNPIAMAMSPKDGKLYVIDLAGAGCGGECVKQVDVAQGTVTTTAIVAQPGLTGIAFDATGDNMYLSVAKTGGPTGHVVKSVYNGASYPNPSAATASCTTFTSANPPDDASDLYVDGATLYLLDGGQGQSDRNVKKATLPCDGTQDWTDVNTPGRFDTPRGLAKDAVTGNLLVSDIAVDRIASVVPADGTTTTFEFGAVSRPLNQPDGIAWLSGGASSFTDSLFVANFGNNRVVATQGDFSVRSAAFLQDRPIDVGFDTATAGTLYILTDRPEILKVTGY